MKVQQYIYGSRWHGLKSFLFQLAVRYNLELEIKSEDKGFIRHTIYFTLEGDKENVSTAVQHAKLILDKFNES